VHSNCLYINYYLNLIRCMMLNDDVRASLEEAEQDVDLLEVKLEKVIIFCNSNSMGSKLYSYHVMLC